MEANQQVPSTSINPTTPQPPVPENTPEFQVSSGKKERRWTSVLSTILIIIAAPLIAFSLTQFVFQSYEVDGPSMETTLQNADRLIVWKVPRTWARITKHDYMPNRGDVVIFLRAELPEPGTGKPKQLIKRVIGLPGDRVVVKDGKLTVFNKEYPEGFEPDTSLPYRGIIQTTPIEGEWTVEKGQVFVCGDNRANSLDSRTFGAIQAHDIVGKLAARILPASKLKLF